MISLLRLGDDTTRMGLLVLPLLLAAVHIAPGSTATTVSNRASLSTPETVGRSLHAEPGGSTLERATEAARLAAGANAERAARGLSPLLVDDRLCAIARAHAFDMATRRYFNHVNPEGESPFDRMARAHYGFGFAGENIALDDDAAKADRELWRSIEHRKNTLETHYVRIGVAAVQTPDGEVFVEEFSD